METNYCEEICDNCTDGKCMKNELFQQDLINRKQKEELVEQIIALNNQIADLKEKLLCSNCGWDNKYPKLKKPKHCLIYDNRKDCDDYKKISNACIGCNFFNNPEHN